MTKASKIAPINEVALTNILTPAAVDPALKGFVFVSADSVPFITLDRHRRFYFNASMRKMFGLRPYDKVAIGYDADTESIAILTQGLDRIPPNFTYVLDKRYYAPARRFIEDFRISLARAPYTYTFSQRTSREGVYIFRLTGAKDADPIDISAED